MYEFSKRIGRMGDIMCMRLCLRLKAKDVPQAHIWRVACMPQKNVSFIYMCLFLLYQENEYTKKASRMI